MRRQQRPPLHKALSIQISCSADDAEQLGLYGIARALHKLSFYIHYREWRRKER